MIEVAEIVALVEVAISEGLGPFDAAVGDGDPA